jgi:hypothetical protein
VRRDPNLVRFGVYQPEQIDIVLTARVAQSASGTVDAVEKSAIGRRSYLLSVSSATKLPTSRDRYRSTIASKARNVILSKAYTAFAFSIPF